MLHHAQWVCGAHVLLVGNSLVLTTGVPHVQYVLLELSLTAL